MSSETVIAVKGLGKRYKLGETLRHDTLRDAISDGARNLMSRIRPRRAGGSDPTRHATGRGAAPAEFWALKDVDFEVRRGEVLGIIGRNGSGKSTLLKILSRITEPTEGEIRIRGRVASLLEVGTGMHPELTGRENVYLNGAILGMKRSDIDKNYEGIVEFAGIPDFMSTPIKRYSSGMRVRLGFAIAAHLEPDILIVDEVLAVGDAAFQRKCLGKMQDVADRDRTVLFVSHSMATIRRLCRRAMLLDAGRIAQEGETDEIASAYMRQGVESRRVFVFEERDHQYHSPLQIEAVELLVPGERFAFLHGEPVGFDLTVSCRENLEDVRIGVGIVYEGIRLCTLHSEPLVMAASPGPRTIRCSLPAGRLLPGGFALVFGAHLAGNGRALDFIGREIPLEISDVPARGAEGADLKALGLVSMEGAWTLFGSSDTVMAKETRRMTTA